MLIQIRIQINDHVAWMSCLRSKQCPFLRRPGRLSAIQHVSTLNLWSRQQWDEGCFSIGEFSAKLSISVYAVVCYICHGRPDVLHKLPCMVVMALSNHVALEAVWDREVETWKQRLMRWAVRRCYLGTVQRRRSAEDPRSLCEVRSVQHTRGPW